MLLMQEATTLVFAGVHHYVRGERGTRLFKTWGQRCALPNPVWW